jgi:hypothetical protein
MTKHYATNLGGCFLQSETGGIKVSGKLLSFPSVQLA